MELGDFLIFLSEQTDIFNLEARVDVSSLEELIGREKADKIAELMWKNMSYRFLYHSTYTHKRLAGSARFSYHCAQSSERQHNSKKIDDKSKHRDKISMQSFDCARWLHIRLSDSTSEAFIKLSHEEAHLPYCVIDVPPEAQKFMYDNPELSVSQIWLKMINWYRKPPFSRRAIYYLCSKIESQKWKRCDDELASARKLLDEASSANCDWAQYRVEPITLVPEEGLIALAFLLLGMIDKWKHCLREIAIDSAWNTNGSRYEVYVLLGEVQGSGLPLGYLLIQSNAATHGAKENLLRQLLRHVRKKKIKPSFTLSDKDFAEINA
ncbi:hypothetical protein EW146_g10517, partial [Bondarzewia mesenterica]